MTDDELSVHRILRVLLLLLLLLQVPLSAQNNGIGGWHLWHIVDNYHMFSNLLKWNNGEISTIKFDSGPFESAALNTSLPSTKIDAPWETNMICHKCKLASILVLHKNYPVGCYHHRGCNHPCNRCIFSGIRFFKEDDFGTILAKTKTTWIATHQSNLLTESSATTQLGASFTHTLSVRAVYTKPNQVISSQTLRKPYFRPFIWQCSKTLHTSVIFLRLIK